VAEIDAEDALVRIHERQRIEPRRAREHPQQVQDAAPFLRHRRGNAEHSDTPRRREHAIPLAERGASDRIENEFDAAVIGDLPRSRLEILGAIIDKMIDPQGAQLAMLGGGCRADHTGADVLRDLRRRNADAAAGRMNENGLAPLQAAHRHEQLPCREIVHRDRRCLAHRQSLRTCKDLLEGDAHHVGIAAEASERENLAAGPLAVDGRAHGVDASADLVAGDHRGRRKIRIGADAPGYIREVDAARFDPGADFVRLRLRVGRLPDGKHLWRSVFGDPDLTH
jgi:hypothetical protein